VRIVVCKNEASFDIYIERIVSVLVGDIKFTAENYAQEKTTNIKEDKQNLPVYTPKL
jgi:hypothetical protein